jgi:hypothetical protein
MDRRRFLSVLIGGVSATAAVRTFPFRVFSFPKELKGNWEGLRIDPFPSPLTTPTLYGGAAGGGKLWTFAGIPYRVNPHLPQNEIWLVREAKRQTLHLHEGPRAGQLITQIIKPGQILRVVDLRPSEGKEPLVTGLESSIL